MPYYEKINNVCGVALESELYLFADQANDQLDDMRREYARLLIRYEEAITKATALENALNRCLAVLAAQEVHHETV